MGYERYGLSSTLRTRVVFASTLDWQSFLALLQFILRRRDGRRSGANSNRAVFARPGVLADSAGGAGRLLFSRRLERRDHRHAHQHRDRRVGHRQRRFHHRGRFGHARNGQRRAAQDDLNVNKKADLWILAQKNIQRVEDLRGKTIGVGGNWGTQFYQVLEALKPAGIDKEVQLVSTGDVANGFLSLQQGSMAAVALTPPYNILAKRQGYRDLVQTGDVISVSPTTGLVTTKESSRRNRKRFAAPFVR